MNCSRSSVLAVLCTTMFVLPVAAQNSNRKDGAGEASKQSLAPDRVPVLPPGSVDVSVSSGNLVIIGSDGKDRLDVQGLGNGAWKIKGLGDTLVNGSKRFTATGVTGNVSISLNDGDDTLNLHDGSIAGSLFIQMGGGGDAATLTNLTMVKYFISRAMAAAARLATTP